MCVWVRGTGMESCTRLLLHCSTRDTTVCQEADCHSCAHQPAAGACQKPVRSLVLCGCCCLLSRHSSKQPPRRESAAHNAAGSRDNCMQWD